MTEVRTLVNLPLITALFVFATLALGSAIGEAVVSLGIGAMMVASYPVLRAVKRREFDPFEPVNGVAVYTVLTMLIRGFLDLHYGGPILGPRYNIGAESFRALVGWVFWYTGLFMAAFIASYYWRGTEQLAKALPVFKAVRISRIGVSLGLAVSVAASLPAAIFLRGRLGVAISEGGYFAASRAGGLSGISFLLRFALVGSYVAVLYMARRRSHPLLVTAAVYALLVSLVVFALMPTKIVVANTIFIIVGAIHYLRHSVRVRTLVIAGVSGLLLMPALMAYRHGWTAQRLWELLRSLPAKPELLLAGILQRSFGADSFVVILDSVAHGKPFELGRTFGSLVWWWVPRALWAEKPLTYAIEFWETFLRQSAYFPQNVSASPTMIGELYLNFWWPGVVIGGLLSGCACRLCYLWFKKQSRGEASVLIYLLSVAVLIKMVEGPVSDHLIELFVNVTIGLIVVVGIPVLLSAARGSAGDAPMLEIDRVSDAHRV
jgi:hypothetical protein